MHLSLRRLLLSRRTRRPLRHRPSARRPTQPLPTPVPLPPQPLPSQPLSPHRSPSPPPVLLRRSSSLPTQPPSSPSAFNRRHVSLSPPPSSLPRVPPNPYLAFQAFRRGVSKNFDAVLFLERRVEHGSKSKRAVDARALREARIPYDRNQQWLALLARSLKHATISIETEEELKDLIKLRDTYGFSGRVHVDIGNFENSMMAERFIRGVKKQRFFVVE